VDIQKAISKIETCSTNQEMSDSEPQKKKLKKCDEEKTIKCFFDQENEKEIILKVLEGEIVTSLMYPLLFDTQIDPSNVPKFYRSLPFLRSLATGTTDYLSLSDQLRHFVHVGVRDLYFASLMNLLNDDDKETLLRVTNLIPDSESYLLEGLSISFHPSMNRKLLRYMHIPCQYLETTHSTNFFIQPTAPSSSTSSAETTLRAVFIDPRDLSYHNFENIVRLDSWFQTTQFTPYTATPPHQLDSNYEIFTLNLLHSAATDRLHELDKLDLYTPPLNSSSRGGNRFIFQSQYLSEQLTQFIRSSGVLKMMSPSNQSQHIKYSAENSFISVNSIFRLNKFSPNDRDFENHLDTPYSDQAHHHFSRYSLLIYLSHGSRHTNTSDDDDGTLSFEKGKVIFHEMNDLTCVIFRQDYEHHGRPFLHSEKVFIRTELIFYIEDDDVMQQQHLKDTMSENETMTTPSAVVLNNGVKGIQYNHQIGRLFSSAVYFTGQSIYQPELSAYAHRCYELSNKLHWNYQSSSLSTQDTEIRTLDKESKGFQRQFLHKKFVLSKDTTEMSQFVTCGSDYWFQRSVESQGDDDLYLKECALFALLDYFNCNVQHTPFRARCETKILSPSLVSESSDEFLTFISTILTQDTSFHTHTHTPPTTNTNIIPLTLNWETSKNISYLPFVSQKPLPKPNTKYCCPFHCQGFVDDEDDESEIYRVVSKVPIVNEYYQTCRTYIELKLKNSPLFLNWLGKDLILNLNSFQIREDKIYILNKTETSETSEKISTTTSSDTLKIMNTNRINFAACWNGGELDSYLSVSEKISSKKLLIPPILFHTTLRPKVIDSFSTHDHTSSQQQLFVHLILDFFQNNWNVTLCDHEIPIPTIRYNDEDASDSFRREVLRQYSDITDYDEFRDEINEQRNLIDHDGDLFLVQNYDQDGEGLDEEDESDEDESDEGDGEEEGGDEK
jgi:hypothetical protein